MKASELEAIWPLTGVTVGDTFPSYPTRTVFRVHSDQGDFMAKVRRTPRQGLSRPDQLYVLEYLREQGYRHAPSLLYTRSGRRTAIAGGAEVSLTEFIPDALHEAGDATWRQLGAAAGTLNRLSGYPIPFAIDVPMAVNHLAARAAGQPFEDHFRELLGRVAMLARLPADALIHGEINDANARRRPDGTVVLVDWDEAGIGARALEYGYPLIVVFLSEGDHAFDDRSAFAFYEAYSATGGEIDPGELFDAALFHALRYMWWGNTELRWARILHALRREAEMCAVVPSIVGR